MAKKVAQRDRTRSKPLTLAALEEYGALAGFVPPQGDFDPDGSWKHQYRLWLVSSGRLAPKPADMHYRGCMVIGRRPLPEGNGITLTVYQSVLQQTPGVHDTSVQMTCAADALTRPRWWKLTNTVLDGHLEPIPEAQVKQTGKVNEGPSNKSPANKTPANKATVRIEHGQRTTTLEVPEPLTTNWSLFDAIQRMPRRKAAPRKFAMLQALDLLKPSQQLTYRGVGKHTLGGNSVQLHHWQHLGQGILPYNYYTDEQGRLLVAIGGLRAYIFDQKVLQLHKKCLESIAERARK